MKDETDYTSFATTILKHGESRTFFGVDALAQAFEHMQGYYWNKETGSWDSDVIGIMERGGGAINVFHDEIAVDGLLADERSQAFYEKSYDNTPQRVYGGVK